MRLVWVQILKLLMMGLIKLGKRSPIDETRPMDKTGPVNSRRVQWVNGALTCIVAAHSHPKNILMFTEVDSICRKLVRNVSSPAICLTSGILISRLRLGPTLVGPRHKLHTSFQSQGSTGRHRHCS